jgi:hypothetical protein
MKYYYEFELGLTEKVTCSYISIRVSNPIHGKPLVLNMVAIYEERPERNRLRWLVEAESKEDAWKQVQDPKGDFMIWGYVELYEAALKSGTPDV